MHTLDSPLVWSAMASTILTKIWVLLLALFAHGVETRAFVALLALVVLYATTREYALGGGRPAAQEQ